jgi:hypothetical protein
MNLLDPTMATEEEAIDFLPRPINLRGLRIGLVENTKKNAEEVLRNLAEKNRGDDAPGFRIVLARHPRHADCRVQKASAIHRSGRPHSADYQRMGDYLGPCGVSEHPDCSTEQPATGIHHCCPRASAPLRAPHRGLRGMGNFPRMGGDPPISRSPDILGRVQVMWPRSTPPANRREGPLHTKQGGFLLESDAAPAR